MQMVRCSDFSGVCTTIQMQDLPLRHSAIVQNSLRSIRADLHITSPTCSTRMNMSHPCLSYAGRLVLLKIACQLPANCPMHSLGCCTSTLTHHLIVQCLLGIFVCTLNLRTVHQTINEAGIAGDESTAFICGSADNTSRSSAFLKDIPHKASGMPELLEHWELPSMPTWVQGVHTPSSSELMSAGHVSSPLHCTPCGIVLGVPETINYKGCDPRHLPPVV